MGDMMDGNGFSMGVNNMDLHKLIHPKPDVLIEEIIKALVPASEIFTLGPRKKLHMNTDNNQQNCFLLLEGFCSFRRKYNDINVHTLHAPLILGLSEMLSPGGFHFLYTETASRIGVVSYENFIKCTQEHPHLWSSIARYLAWVSQRLMFRDMELSERNVYSIIRTLLIRLNEETDEYKNRVIASNYILDHTLLSKSAVMSILADLKKGEFIKTKKGRLIEIINLPEKY